MSRWGIQIKNSKGQVTLEDTDITYSFYGKYTVYPKQILNLPIPLDMPVLLFQRSRANNNSKNAHTQAALYFKWLPVEPPPWDLFKQYSKLLLGNKHGSGVDVYVFIPTKHIRSKSGYGLEILDKQGNPVLRSYRPPLLIKNYTYFNTWWNGDFLESNPNSQHLGYPAAVGEANLGSRTKPADHYYWGVVGYLNHIAKGFWHEREGTYRFATPPNRNNNYIATIDTRLYDGFNNLHYWNYLKDPRELMPF